MTDLVCPTTHKNTVVGETGYSPGDRATNLWPFYDPSQPVNVMSVGETACGPDYHVVRSGSTIMAIEYITEGSGILEINGKTYRPEKNCVVLLTKNSVHSYAADPEKPWKKSWIVFDGPFMQNMLDAYLPKDVYCFPNCSLAPYFHRIKEQLHTRKGDYPYLLEGLSSILYEIVLYLNHKTMRQELTMPEKVRMALDAQVEGKLSLGAVCKEFNYSKNYIIHLFRSAYGVTPYRYFETKKIDVAKLYLCNTNFPIDEIAQMLSYADRNYFSNCFKKHTGYAPGEYRKKHQRF